MQSLSLVDSNHCLGPFHVLPATGFIRVAGLTATGFRGAVLVAAALWWGRDTLLDCAVNLPSTLDAFVCVSVSSCQPSAHRALVIQ